MFRQHLVQAISCSKIFAKSRSKPKFLLRHLKNLFCATTKGDFTAHYWLPRGKKRPQDSLCWAEKPLSLVPFDKYTSQKILFRRLFLAPALKKLYLFGGGRQGGRGGILSKKTNFGGDGRRYNAFTTFTHFSIKIFFAEFCGWGLIMRFRRDSKMTHQIGDSIEISLQLYRLISQNI